MTIAEQLSREIDSRIARLMAEEERALPFYGMMKYHLGWLNEKLEPVNADPGKRIRAKLCLLTCEAAGGLPEQAIAAATAVELVHNFSLLHDDIQDRSEYRRHRRAAWAIWGEAQAINAGDGMLALAQLALAEGDSADPHLAVRALRALNRSCQLLCEGQFLDLEYERRLTVTQDDYYAMIARKTAALLETSCFLGALYGGAEDSSLEGYSGFGKYLGLAFQIRDDFLGTWGDPEETGKPSAADVASKKKALPMVYALAKATATDRALLGEILARPGTADNSEVREILGILDRCGAADYTSAEVGRMSQAALAALASAHPKSAPYEEMVSLCHQLTDRTK